MSKLDRQPPSWNLEGRFLGFVFKDDKPKRLQLMTADGERSVKLAKDIRTSVSNALIPGDWIQVWGEKTGHKAKTRQTLQIGSLKAYKVSKAAPSQSEKQPPAIPQKPKSLKPAPAATILVCQKSDCVKRGSKAVCQALETALSDRDLADQVTIRATGCMKDCKAGPNLIFMPEKTRHKRVSAHDAVSLIDEKFPSLSPQESSD